MPYFPPPTTDTDTGVSLAVNGGAAQTSGSMTITNSNGVTFGTAAGVITASVASAAANAVNGGGASSGTVVFSNGNNITFGVNASTITASASFGARAGQVMLYDGALASLQTYPANTTTVHTIYMEPFLAIAESISVKTLGFLMSRSTGTTLAGTAYAGFYSLNGSTLSLISSSSNNYSLSTTAQWSSTMRFDITGMGAFQLTGGAYWVGLNFRATSGQPTLIGRASSGVSGIISQGTNSSNVNASAQLQPGLGSFTLASNTSNAMPDSVALSNIQGQNAGTAKPFIMITEIP